MTITAEPSKRRGRPPKARPEPGQEMFTVEEVASLIESVHADALRRIQHIQGTLLGLSEELHDYATTLLIKENEAGLREAIREDWHINHP